MDIVKQRMEDAQKRNDKSMKEIGIPTMMDNVLGGLIGAGDESRTQAAVEMLLLVVKELSEKILVLEEKSK